MTERRIETPRDYYSHPEVATQIYRHLGNMKKLSRNPSLLLGDEDFRNITREYLSFTNTAKLNEKEIPYSSIKPWEMPKELRERPTTEIFQSLWTVDAPTREGIPHTQVITWDIEYYNHGDNTRPFRKETQFDTFSKMNGAYEAIIEQLNLFGINYLVVMTGRGYHFLTQVPHTSSVLMELIEIGNNIEEPVSAMQAHVPPNWFSKRNRPIPPNTEMANKGANYLMQYLFSQSINNARNRCVLPVEISDRGNEGISFDSTAIVRHVGTAKIGILGSLYLKPLIKNEYLGNDDKILTRVAYALNGEKIDSLENLMAVRRNYSRAVDNLHDSGGVIPDGSVGIHKLIHAYNKSGMKKLHDAIDKNLGDPPEVWEYTYRKDNYQWTKEKFGEQIYELIRHAKPKLLQPDSLNYFINELFDKWEGTFEERIGHVVSLLRCIYEDPYFHFGKREISNHESKVRHAKGWVTVILGQRYEKK